jgi:hypothetical protein
MPFLRRLIEREHSRLHATYSGVPSTTAAFQGELFDGVKRAVPAFSVMERASGRLVRMFESAVAARVERQLQVEKLKRRIHSVVQRLLFGRCARLSAIFRGLAKTLISVK